MEFGQVNWQYTDANPMLANTCATTLVQVPQHSYLYTNVVQLPWSDSGPSMPFPTSMTSSLAGALRLEPWLRQSTDTAAMQISGSKGIDVAESHQSTVEQSRAPPSANHRIEEHRDAQELAISIPCNVLNPASANCNLNAMTHSGTIPTNSATLTGCIQVEFAIKALQHPNLRQYMGSCT